MQTNSTLEPKTFRRVPGGALIAFEGIDGSGKTTQARAMREALEHDGYEAIFLREPTDGPFGRRLRELMVAGRDAISPHQEFELFLKDREEDVRLNIRPALERGAVICLDRYYISSMAYQGALGLSPEFIRLENEKIAPRPDLILYFRIPVDQSLDRIRNGRTEGQNLFELQHYQLRVYEVFESIQDPPLVRIDAARSMADVSADALCKVRELLARKSAG